jgi:hypothetical protein
MLTATRFLRLSAANMSKIKRTLITFAIWLGVQFIALLVFPGNMIAPMVFASDAVVIVALWAIKYFKAADLVRHVPIKVFLASLVLGYAALYSVEIIQGQFDIPNLLDDTFDILVHSVWGFFAVCLIGPIMEEIMMRRVVLAEIREATGKKWLAIIISAFLFAVMHGNPIQIVFAMPAGILLGWLYCKTGSLLVPIGVHIMNNTISFFTLRAGDDEPIDITDPYTILSLTAAIMVTVSMIIWMVGFYRRQQITEQ